MFLEVLFQLKYTIYCVNFYRQKDKYKHEWLILTKYLFVQNVIIRSDAGEIYKNFAITIIKY